MRFPHSFFLLALPAQDGLSISSVVENPHLMHVAPPQSGCGVMQLEFWELRKLLAR